MDSSLVFNGDMPASTIGGMVARGALRRVAPGVYVREDNDPTQVVRAEWRTIVGRLFPDAVVTDRSAPSGGPVDDVLYVARDGRPRDAVLPGLRIRARRGAGPQPDDVSLPGGLHLASVGRGLAENCLASRPRGGNIARTLDDSELGDWIDRLCRNEGEQRLAQHRLRAEELADVLGVPRARLARLNELIGLALTTRQSETSSAALAARAAGHPVDQPRVDLFERLITGLAAAAPQNHPAPDRDRAGFEPFAEAYFSNFIEGTEFEFDEAARIVYDGEIPQARPKDAHDIIGTYRLLADRAEMALPVRDGDEFIEAVRRRHGRIMDGRPEVRPGEFKTRANRAGGTVFVDPTLVPGTLAAGFDMRDRLDTAWERALYVAFVVAEVHPFDDGNGRVARAMMAGELDVGNQCRIIVPTVFRTDYLDGLRMLSRRSDPSVFIKAMRYAQDFTASIDFSEYAVMRAQLEEANAFNEPESPDRLRVLGDWRAAADDAAPWRR